MSKSFNKFTIPKILPRNGSALPAMMRRSAKFKHRSVNRGGNRNLQADYLDEMDDEDLDEVG